MVQLMIQLLISQESWVLSIIICRNLLQHVTKGVQQQNSGFACLKANKRAIAAQVHGAGAPLSGCCSVANRANAVPEAARRSQERHRLQEQCSGRWRTSRSDEEQQLSISKLRMAARGNIPGPAIAHALTCTCACRGRQQHRANTVQRCVAGFPATPAGRG